MTDIDAVLPPADWDDLLQAWLHDPFDKALAIRGHESRAARYASAALGREVPRKGLHRLAADADRTAAMVERLPAPTAGAAGERAVGVADGLRLAHPMSGACVELKPGNVDPDRAVALLKEIVDGLPGPRERFLAVWRLLPDRIAAEFGEDAARLPADTRIPDHTLFQHVDVTAGLHAAGAPGGAACLSFALGPVQPFIEAARSVRDLWSGSALLSWLAFQAMKPVLGRLGPTAFVYPTLRGAPLADFWLRREAGLGERVPCPAPHAGRAPSLPNRFVAVAPWGRDGAAAAALRDACVDAARAGWRRLADAVRRRLDPAFAPLSQDWARFWEPQIESTLDFRGAVAPLDALDDDRLARLVGAADFASGWPDAQKVRDLSRATPAAHRPPYGQDHAGRWQAQMEMSARLMAATRAVRHVPLAGDAGRGPSPAKCTLFGSWEQMGPAKYDASRTFWERAAERTSVDGVRLRSRERLCAVALTKRFAGPALLAAELGLSPDDLRFPDTATVAAAEWLAGAGIDPDEERRRGGHWSGLWLHWRRRHEVDDERPVPESLWKRLCEARTGRRGRPPAYYAVIAMDGDHMGRWLAGEKTPALRRLLHPKLRAYFEGLGDPRAEEALDARRPVGPALHAAISAALSTFATEVAPTVVAGHHGALIYSGGDDVLALCPVSTAFACVRSLRDAFSGRDDPGEDGWRDHGGRRRITMGADASMSAGVALVHYKEDLRDALAMARAAERRAKGREGGCDAPALARAAERGVKAGRDRVALVTARRSGEVAQAVCPWPFVPWVDKLRRAFAGGASDRWTYRLRAESAALASGVLPRAAVRSEIGRLVNRGANDGGGGSLADLDVPGMFDTYGNGRTDDTSEDVLRDFTTLCQAASFMARGGDD